MAANTKTNRGFNATTSAAIVWCEEHPEEWNQLLSYGAARALNDLSDSLFGRPKDEEPENREPIAKEIADILRQRGVTMYANFIAMRICKRLEVELDAMIESIGGTLLADGLTKKSIAYFLDVNPSNLKVRYPHLDEIATAQDRADETGETQHVNMGHGIIKDVNPQPID